MLVQIAYIERQLYCIDNRFEIFYVLNYLMSIRYSTVLHNIHTRIIQGIKINNKV